MFAAHAPDASNLAPIVTPPAAGRGLDDDLLVEHLLAMPEDDYMNDAQLRFFRRHLLSLREAVALRARQPHPEAGEVDLIMPDPADQATLEQEQALEWRVRDLDRKLMKRIDDALARIAAGDYGWCEETGDPIGLPRLLASPTATLTVEAQARLEVRERLYRN